MTLDDIQRVAKKYLDTSRKAILIVGQKKEILLGHPNHPVKLDEFGPITELPLRDPLTMQPMAKGIGEKVRARPFHSP